MENIQRKLLGIGLSILAVGFIGTALALAAAYETIGEAEACARAERCRAACLYTPDEEGRKGAGSEPDTTAAGDRPETADAAPGGAEVANPQLKQTNR